MAARLRLQRLTVDSEDGRVRVDVELAYQARTLQGRGEVPVSDGAGVRASAVAAVAALNQVLTGQWRLRVDEALTQNVGQRQAVVVQLRLQAEEVEEQLVGSAVNDRIFEEAAVRAVLNAAERRAAPLMP